MSLQSIYKRTVDWVSLEYVILITMFISSAYMFWESYNFTSSSAATFPRLTAGVVLIGTVLLLGRSYLPEPLYSFVAESADLINVDDDFVETDIEDDDDDDDVENEVSTVGRPIHDSVFAALLTVGYGVVGYAIGILWASPLFILVYGLWFRLSARVILLLVVVALLVGFGFYEALGLRIDRGEIFLTEGVL